MLDASLAHRVMGALRASVDPSTLVLRGRWLVRPERAGEGTGIITLQDLRVHEALLRPVCALEASRGQQLSGSVLADAFFIWDTDAGFSGIEGTDERMAWAQLQGRRLRQMVGRLRPRWFKPLLTCVCACVVSPGSFGCFW